MKWGVRRSKEELRYDRYSIMATLNRNLKNVNTPNGVKVNKISIHSLDQIEARSDRKVSSKDVLNALSKPLYIGDVKIDKSGLPSIRYIGSKATVNVNPDNGVIATVWKTGHRAIRKYSKKG
jgi:hypothetical protein